MSSAPSGGGAAGDPDDPPTVAAAGSRLATALLSRPAGLARHTVALAGELARIGLGSSGLAPDPGDDRFAAPAWSADPLLRRVVQTHLATTAAAAAMLDDAGLDAGDAEVLRAVVESVADVVAPSNNPVLRALAARHAPPETTGAAGAVAEPAPPPAPAVTGTRRLTVGEDVAATGGAVVLRTDVFELLHYLPQTREVHALPVLVVAPPGLPCYLADLSPGRSLVEHLVRAGEQVLLVSWHPGATGDPDTLGQALLDALDAAERIARTTATVVLGIGGGADLTAGVLAHLAAVGLQARVAAAVLVGLDPRAATTDGRVPRDLRQWLADTADAPTGPGTPADLLGTPLDPAAVDRDGLVVADAADVAVWARLAGSGPVRVVETSHAEFVDPPADDRESWWEVLTDWLGARTGERREAPAELGGRGMHAIAPSPGEYVSAR
ncbi:hypothetical protein [Pseudonocardia sp. N23]|uniref:hypothetical protein n=1 Tax=Pseudonocardia sp. N23 TaxID=1987376 RepID=UPI000BFD7ECE|nr:hypothetical protein [Pseudonocardia sp. N23]GAY10476.1 polyhydroxyalkanoic acid synthase [Pseudonocardia sp. N23]